MQVLFPNLKGNSWVRIPRLGALGILLGAILLGTAHDLVRPEHLARDLLDLLLVVGGQPGGLHEVLQKLRALLRRTSHTPGYTRGDWILLQGTTRGYELFEENTRELLRVLASRGNARHGITNHGTTNLLLNTET